MQNYFFLILGMHRSGTSFLARCLNVSGVYLGEKLLSDGNISENPKGFWENEDFTKIASKIMANNNTRWDKNTSNLKCSDTLKQQFKKLVNEHIANSYVSTGIKDPRLLLLLDSILDVFPENKLYVGIFRHPLKVAESLKIRDNFDYKKSLELWQAYNLKLLYYVNNNNSFLFDFDWPKEKLLDEISLFVKKIGLLDTDLNSVYSEDLFRSDKSFNTSYKLPEEIENTYQKLKKRSMQNNTNNIVPISFSSDETREIMTKMMNVLNKFTESNQGTYEAQSLYDRLRKNKRKLRKSLRKFS